MGTTRMCVWARGTFCHDTCIEFSVNRNNLGNGCWEHKKIVTFLFAIAAVAVHEIHFSNLAGAFPLSFEAKKK